MTIKEKNIHFNYNTTKMTKSQINFIHKKPLNLIIYNRFTQYYNVKSYRKDGK